MIDAKYIDDKKSNEENMINEILTKVFPRGTKLITCGNEKQEKITKKIDALAGAVPKPIKEIYKQTPMKKRLSYATTFLFVLLFTDKVEIKYKMTVTTIIL